MANPKMGRLRYDVEIRILEEVMKSCLHLTEIEHNQIVKCTCKGFPKGFLKPTK